MAVLSAKRYCRKMLDLSADPYQYCQRMFFEDNKSNEIDDENPVDKYIVRVIDLHKEGKLREHLDELERDCPFPDDLRGYLHEHTNGGADKEFQPFHLMYKLDETRDEDRGITFEILIEYSFLEPEMDYYYGIKAISDNKSTTYDFIDHVTMLSSRWFELISLKKNQELDNFKLHRTYFPTCYDKMKFTNNACDGTFWIGWVRVEISDWAGIKNTVEKALRRSYFESFLDYLRNHPESDPIVALEPKAEKQMRELTEWMQRKSDNGKWKIDGKTVGAETFVKTFIDRACSVPYTGTGKPILRDLGSGVYQFNISDNHARYFIQTLFNPDQSLYVSSIYKKYPCPNHLVIYKNKGFVKLMEKHLKVQWAKIKDVFQREDGSPLPPNPGSDQFKYGMKRFQTPELRQHIGRLLESGHEKEP